MTPEVLDLHKLGSEIQGFSTDLWDKVSWLIVGAFLICRAKKDEDMKTMIKEHLNEKFKDVRKASVPNVIKKWLCDVSVRVAVWSLEVEADPPKKEFSPADRTTLAWKCAQDWMNKEVELERRLKEDGHKSDDAKMNEDGLKPDDGTRNEDGHQADNWTLKEDEHQSGNWTMIGTLTNMKRVLNRWHPWF